MKNTRSTAPSVSPIVRRMPISRPLFFTSMISPEMMFIAAISTRIDRITNITLSSISSARRNAPAESRHVQPSASCPAAAITAVA